MWMSGSFSLVLFVVVSAAEVQVAQPRAIGYDPFAMRLDFTESAMGTAFSLSSEPEKSQPLAEPFAEGARYWTLTGGVSRDAHIGRVYLTQLSIDDYVVDDFAFRWGLTLGVADPDQVDGGVQGGPEIGIRWHFFSRERFSTFIDSSVATVLHENPLTEESLRFNFDVQVGFGATLQMAADAHLLGGFRWHHLSNARIQGKEHNLGYDGPMIYFGFMKKF